jgi:hypothetical protein
MLTPLKQSVGTWRVAGYTPVSGRDAWSPLDCAGLWRQTTRITQEAPMIEATLPLAIERRGLYYPWFHFHSDEWLKKGCKRFLL